MTAVVRGEIRRVPPALAEAGLVVVIARPAVAAATGGAVCVPVLESGAARPYEAPLGRIDGVPVTAVADCSAPVVVPLEELGSPIGSVGPVAIEGLDGALRYALDVPGTIPGRVATLRGLAEPVS